MVVQLRSATGSRSVVAPLAKQAMEMMGTPKQGPVPCTKGGNALAAQEMTCYGAAVMGSNHECGQNGLVYDCNCSHSRSKTGNKCKREGSYG